MYATFKFETLPLKDILLDDQNPRLVTPAKLSSQKAILAYLYEHEDLDDFVRKIAREGRNPGGERPYVVKSGGGYVVLEGNTRIAAYKVLTGLMAPPSGYTVPHIPAASLAALANVDCAVAPNRESVRPIMVSSHFGRGDKAPWKYLGSRKAVFDEWKANKSLPHIAKEFELSQGDVKSYILEYLLYQKALGLTWTAAERARLTDPAVAFNPPVRFLETRGHKEKMGISYDTTNLKVVFEAGAEKKFKHLLQKLVIAPVKGLGATATFESVFEDFIETKGRGSPSSGTGTGTSPSTGSTVGGKGSSSGGGSTTPGTSKPQRKANALFAYEPKMTNALVVQLMKEAREIDIKRFPASATFLLRNIVESVLKHIIDDQKANKGGSSLDLERSLNLCVSAHVSLPGGDKSILTQFKKDHLSYLNLGAHGNVIPNPDRVAAARDCIDQFIKKHV